MPTPDEVDSVSDYGPIDLHNGGGMAHLSRWQSATYMGRPLPSGRWYCLLSTDGVTTLGFIECSSGSVYAFREGEIGRGQGVELGSMDSAIRHLARGDQ